MERRCRRMKRRIEWASALTVLSVFLILAVWQASDADKAFIGGSTVKSLDTGWTLRSGSMVVENASLPFKMALGAGEVYTAETLLDSSFNAQQVLRIRLSMQDLSVLLDGVEVFRSTRPRGGLLAAPSASLWQLVPLPPESEGRMLTLVMTSPVGAFSGNINEIAYGSGAGLLFDLLRSQWPALLEAMILVLLGSAFLVVHWYIRRLSDNRLLYLGLFSILVGFWIFSEAKLMQFVSGSRYLIGSSSYLALGLAPAVFLQYVRHTYLDRHARLLSAFSYAFLAATGASLLLQAGGVSSFFDSAIALNLLLAGATVAVLVLTIVEGWRFGNRQAQRHLAAIGGFLAFVLLEVAMFFTGSFSAVSGFMKIGIGILFVFFGYDSIRYMNQLLLGKKESEIYESLAYKDLLTGGGNRYAFERDLERLLASFGQQQFRLVLGDMNNLKGINDGWGHKAGDDAIATCFGAMRDAFSSAGGCYRLSGDEFACIMAEVSEERYAACRQRFEELLKTRGRDLPYPLAMAMGSEVYPLAHVDSFLAFYNHIDNLMYVDKKRMKETFS